MPAAAWLLVRAAATSVPRDGTHRAEPRPAAFDAECTPPLSEVELVVDRFVGIPTSEQRNRPLRSPKWKRASTIVEGEFHSPRFFVGKPILFLTLVPSLGYHRCSSFGRDPIEPRKLRQPNPPTGQVGRGLRSERTAVREEMSVDPRRLDGTQGVELHPRGRDAERPERVIHLTLFSRTVLYVATGKRS